MPRESIASVGYAIWALTWPAMVRNYINCTADRITLAFVGHYDYKVTSHYDGASLGKMYSNSTAFSVGLGLNIALTIFRYMLLFFHSENNLCRLLIYRESVMI